MPMHIGGVIIVTTVGTSTIVIITATTITD